MAEDPEGNEQTRYQHFSIKPEDSNRKYPYWVYAVCYALWFTLPFWYGVALGWAISGIILGLPVSLLRWDVSMGIIIVLGIIGFFFHIARDPYK